MWLTEKNKIRLDSYLVENNFFEYIHIARSHILRGNVLLDNKPVTKAGFKLNLKKRIPDIRIRNITEIVSRSYNKLKKYFDQFPIDLEGKICFDLGCGPGGFTQVMLEKNADIVFMVDVGKQIVDPKLRNHPKIRILEKTNIKSLYVKEFNPKIVVDDLFWENRDSHSDIKNDILGISQDALPLIEIDSKLLFTSDVSFLSLKDFLPPIFEFTLAAFEQKLDLVLLLKPQFELSKETIRKFPNAIVTDVKMQKRAIMDFLKFLKDYYIFYHNCLLAYNSKGGIKKEIKTARGDGFPFTFFVRDISKSDILGNRGNQEFFIRVTVFRGTHESIPSGNKKFHLSKKSFRFLMNLR